ncbi:MAG: TetR/AcrR family transcriptional regulator [Saprospiraceae bacterium]|nr:TetR/AcrR family transcriptional regulator [Saprospiraceae bacterium]
MCPRSPAQIEEIRQRSMRLILDSALHLFAHQGFHNTTISQIAKRAGVSKGLIYNYFSSKEELVGGIIQEAMETGEEIMSTIKDREMDPWEAIDKSIDDIFLLVEKNPTYWKLLMSLSFQDDVLKQFESLLRKQEFKNLEHLTELLVRIGAKDPTLEAMYISALLDGILLHYIHFKDQYPLSQMKDFLKAKTRDISR